MYQYHRVRQREIIKIYQNILRFGYKDNIISLRIVVKTLLCITVDELSTFLKSSSDLKN